MTWGRGWAARARAAGHRAAGPVLSLAVLGAVVLAPLALARTANTARPPGCRTFRYHSAPYLGAQHLCMNLGVATHGVAPGSYLFLTPGGKDGTGAGIFRSDGSLVWWDPAPAPRIDDLSVVHYRGQALLAVWSGHHPTRYPFQVGTVLLYDEHYRLVGRIAPGAPFGSAGVDMHEFRITPQGNALIGINDPVSTRVDGHRETVVQYVVQELSLVRGSHGIHTGKVLFQWQSLPHVPVSQSHLPDPGANGVWDYFHGNDIAQDTDGNLLISARNTWGIYKVNVPSGQVMWQVGAKPDHTLSEPWCMQHDVGALGDDRYTLFDDGGQGPGCDPPVSGHASRALIVEVNPSRTPATVRLIRAYTHSPPVHARLCGSMQLLPGGDVLIDWGDVPDVTEYSPTGRPVMDLALSNWSYRAFRFVWTGLPTTRPAVAAQVDGRRTRVWASWNGSTQLAAWRILAGPSLSRLGSQGSPWARTGFETTMWLNGRYAEVQVQALGAGGKVLMSSRVVSPSG